MTCWFWAQWAGKIVMIFTCLGVPESSRNDENFWWRITLPVFVWLLTDEFYPKDDLSLSVEDQYLILIWSLMCQTNSMHVYLFLCLILCVHLIFYWSICVSLSACLLQALCLSVSPCLSLSHSLSLASNFVFVYCNWPNFTRYCLMHFKITQHNKEVESNNLYFTWMQVNFVIVLALCLCPLVTVPTL